MTFTNSNYPSLAILHRMASILDQVTKVSYNVSGLAMVTILCLVINEVSMRYLFNSPTTWSSDVNQWLFALTIMLALPEITRVNGNVAITVILERMPQHRKQLISRILAILSFLACLLAFYISADETVRQINAGITTNWIRPIPKWWISVAIPFGFLLSGIQFLRIGIRPKPQIEV